MSAYASIEISNSDRSIILLNDILDEVVRSILKFLRSNDASQKQINSLDKPFIDISSQYTLCVFKFKYDDVDIELIVFNGIANKSNSYVTVSAPVCCIDLIKSMSDVFANNYVVYFNENTMFDKKTLVK